MSSDDEKPAAGAPHQTAPLFRALDKSAQVHEKVEHAATTLSAINAVLKDGIADGICTAGKLVWRLLEDGNNREASSASRRLAHW